MADTITSILGELLALAFRPARGTSQRNVPVAATAPSNWATTKPGAFLRAGCP
jgi:hypothetical protein